MNSVVVELGLQRCVRRRTWLKDYVFSSTRLSDKYHRYQSDRLIAYRNSVMTFSWEGWPWNSIRMRYFLHDPVFSYCCSSLDCVFFAFSFATIRTSFVTLPWPDWVHLPGISPLNSCGGLEGTSWCECARMEYLWSYIFSKVWFCFVISWEELVYQQSLNNRSQTNACLLYGHGFFELWLIATRRQLIKLQECELR